MRPLYLAAALVLLGLALPASPAQAAGVVSTCDESHLTAALSGGGTVTFTCSGTITLTSTITIAANILSAQPTWMLLSPGRTGRLAR